MTAIGSDYQAMFEEVGRAWQDGKIADLGTALRTLDATIDATAKKMMGDLWQGLAQLAVGMTHLARGNHTGAVTLLVHIIPGSGNPSAAAPGPALPAPSQPQGEPQI